MDDETLRDLGEQIEASLPQAVTGMEVAYGELNITAHADQVLAVLAHLRDDTNCRFRQLIDVTAVDYPDREVRFDVVYHLLSVYQNQRIRLKIQVAEDAPVASAVGLFRTANWFEREVFDMFGIAFANHPDLRRLLTDYGFTGYPLRKDFPVSGFVQVRYDDELKRVVNEPVRLTQEFRSFDFVSPWEAAEYILPGDEKAETPAASASSSKPNDKAK